MDAPLTRKELTHERIVETAARAICRTGFQGLGVADIMKEAGLTHGGFYAHFAGRGDDASRLAQHALLIAVLLAALFVVALPGFGPKVYTAMGGAGPALDAALAYSTSAICCRPAASSSPSRSAWRCTRPSLAARSGWAAGAAELTSRRRCARLQRPGV